MNAAMSEIAATGLGFWIIYGLVATFLWLRGVAKTRRAVSQARTVLDERKVCSCSHGRALHDFTSKSALCHATQRQANRWSMTGVPIGWEHVNCRCKTYDGPVPIEQFIDQRTFPSVIEE